MCAKRKKLKLDAQRERRRIERLADDGRSKNAGEVPLGAVPADPSQQVPNHSYSPPPLYYMDKEFVCVDCGRRETWTAGQQKWYYEVVKGSLYATAVRCRECRKTHSQQHQGHGDPNPIKHVGSLMKRIRSSIEPYLLESGFQFDGESKAADLRSAWLNYSRPGLILGCGFEPREARLIAETMDDRAECKVIANVELSDLRSTFALLERVDAFISAVREYVRSLPEVTDALGGIDT